MIRVFARNVNKGVKMIEPIDFDVTNHKKIIEKLNEIITVLNELSSRLEGVYPNSKDMPR